MDVTVVFRFGPVHVPLGRRTWGDGPELGVEVGQRTYTMSLRRPHRFHTHFLDDSSSEEKVGDAYIPIAVRCDLEDTEERFKEIANAVLEQFSPLVEAIRVRTAQPHLRLREIGDLYVVNVLNPEGEELEDITNKYKEWIESQERERPLPLLTRVEWELLKTIPQDFEVDLHDSLIMDAELELESNGRVGVLYAALACEVFIQKLLGEIAEHDPKLKKWMDWADPQSGQEGSVSLRGYYDLGLMLATGKSLKDNQVLWSKLGLLVRARNDVAHRGHLPRNFDPVTAIDSAKEIMAWVRSHLPDRT